MLRNSLKAIQRGRLTFTPVYGVLDHKRMEDMKKKVY